MTFGIDIGTGNGLVRKAVERRFGVRYQLPDVAELAAYGAALHIRNINKGE